jgi:hypothetical protein
MLGHVGDEFVEHASRAEQGMRAVLTGVGFEEPVGTVRNSVCGVIIPPKEFSRAPAQTAFDSGCPS